MIKELTFFAKTEGISSLNIKYLHPVIHTVSHSDLASLVHAQMMGIDKLPFVEPLTTKFSNGFAIGVKHLNPVIVLF